MDERTCRYLAGRFGDHYRRESVELPPGAHAREWGHIPWDETDRTRMVRHQSLTEIGDLNGFLARTRPRHVYFSAGQYGDPGAPHMDLKEWRGSDLIFDLDADHLPNIDPETDSYAEMLAAGKVELQQLLSFLEQDFAFQELSIVFSGGRGYHVHVRDNSVEQLDREARREIVDYVSGTGISMETIVQTQQVAGVGRQTPAEQRRVDPSGGWSRRMHQTLLALTDELSALPEAKAIEKLSAIDGIGKKKANTIHRVMREQRAAIAAGNIDVHPAFLPFVDECISRAITQQGAAIDEPVTTDVNRLIRLPGSLHGGSGLIVQPIERDAVSTFDPLADPIPPTFRDLTITIEVTEAVSVELDTEYFDFEPGVTQVPEYVGIHLMARGEAIKRPEGSAN